jgi:hypothetical protein
VAPAPPGTSVAVRSSYTFREFGYAVVKSFIQFKGGDLRIAALPPPVSTGSGSKGLSQSGGLRLSKAGIPLAAIAIICRRFER